MSAVKSIFLWLGVFLIVAIAITGGIFYYQQQGQAHATSLLTQYYTNAESRYTIQYPTEWVVDSDAPGTVIFSGKKETPSFYSTVNIQTILTKKTGGQFATVREFMKDLQDQVEKQSTAYTFLEEGPIELRHSDQSTVKGEYLLFTYQYQGEQFKQWQVVVLRQDEQVFYAWAYTAPVELYDANVAIARAMLKTWVIY